MDRPFAEYRPIGPLADASMMDSETTIIVNYGTEIPSDMHEEAKSDVLFHLQANGFSVDDIEVGPENTDDSIMVVISNDSFMVDDIKTSVAAGVAEMEDSGISIMGDPTIEIIP